MNVNLLLIRFVVIVLFMLLSIALIIYVRVYFCKLFFYDDFHIYTTNKFIYLYKTRTFL